MYPAVSRDETVVDDIGGHTVADPYRWLENASPDTEAFVEAQNALSRPKLDALPNRDAFERILHRVLSEPTRNCPVQRGGWLFAWHNDGDDQPRVVRARSFDELEDAQTILDPNGGDGTTAIVQFAPNDDASLLAYAVSEAGSDWHTIRVLDLASLEDTGVEIRWAKWNMPTWLPGGRRFTYWAYPEPTGNALTDENAAGAMHAFDMDSRRSELYWQPDDPRTMPYRFPDDEWCLLFARRGMESRTQVFVRRHDDADLRLLVDGEGQWWPIAVRGRELICGTDENTPRGRVVAVDLLDGTRRELVAERPDQTLLAFDATRTGYVAHWMVDAQSFVELLDLDGVPGDALPIGDGVSIAGLATHEDSDDVFLATSTFTDRGQRAHAVVDGATLVDWHTTRPDGQITVLSRTRRIRVTSSDGAEVPAFVIEPDGLTDGPRPTLMWGYGGFNLPVMPDHKPIFAAWIAAGGTLVIPNLRGGGEFGEQWHEQGTKAHKQQVFDDLFAVAERIIADGVTTPSQLALHGRSNGGLLAAAGLTQRPDLWAAVLPSVGVLDMLRYHRFTIGWAWARDYGNPDEPGVAEYLLRYSPLHNVRAVEYPPTLITTADHDDRVVPAHSYKFAAELQHTGEGGPFWLSVDTRAGHGMGKPKHAQLREYTDQLAFAAAYVGLTPRLLPPSR